MTPTIRVLYAEDNPQDADLTRSHFAAAAPDVRIEIATTGQDALERVRRGSPDLVLLDHRLPDMEGLEVLRELAASGSTMPIVLVTGVGDEDLVVKALRLGAVDYVPKSGDYLKTLPDLLRRALEDSRAHQRELRVPVLGPVRILYAEHNAMDVELTRQHLAEAAPHFSIDAAATCAEALDRLEHGETWDFLLVDLRMPDMSGLEFIHEARQRHLKLPPFIIISGKGDDAAAIATLKLGAADYIAKRDGYRHQLVHTIERAISNHRLRLLNRRLQDQLEQRERTEEALDASDVRFRATFEQAAVGIAHVAPDGRWLRVNQKLCDIVGYSREELLTRTFQDITHPDDLQTDLDGSRRVLAGEIATYSIEKRYFHKTGHVVWIYLTVSLVRRATGEPHYFVSVIEDISLRKRAEAGLRLQSAGLNATVDGIVITDPGGVIEWTNPAFTTLTGYRADEAAGKTLGALVKSGAHDEAFYRQLWDTIRQGDVWRGETTNRRKDGTLYTEEQSITPVRDADGAITHFIAVKRDLTDQKQLEAQLLQAQRMDAVGRLAGGVAHDFNNMLGVIAGYTELALSNVDPSDPVHADLREIARAGQRSAALVRQLLAFARRQPIEPRVLDLSDVIASTLKMLARLIGEHIDLVWRPASDLWPVKMDPIQIDQILANLAVNARDAIQGVGRLTIETSSVDIDQAYCAAHPGFTPGKYVCLSVSDNGCGMDEETRARVFEPFFTTKPLGQGTGLGLATVYGIVKQNHGFINVYSEPGHGTTFTIYLPAFEPAIREAAAEPVALKAPTGTETVLLVEDEIALLALSRRMLAQLGYTVLDANSPDQAIDLATSYQGDIHLLMTDVVMPGMSGPDLLQGLAAARPGLRCLFTSGYPSSVIAPQGVLEPGTHFLQKPFSRQALAEKLREALDT